MSDPAFQLCRNPRCRSRMPPAMGEHSQFCTRGCWEQFHRKRCVVCERARLAPSSRCWWENFKRSKFQFRRPPRKSRAPHPVR
jgi:hypothetical protein